MRIQLPYILHSPRVTIIERIIRIQMRMVAKSNKRFKNLPLNDELYKQLRRELKIQVDDS